MKEDRASEKIGKNVILLQLPFVCSYRNSEAQIIP
jgi:hypothetical protein